ncbi:MAG: NADH-quinone oxidoreductase subunit NuoF [Acidobacteria bacterium]|nr:NADH-quinone oxidoreductase subunit NuoF [Acidobacteriota bacterium]MBI3662484.1 NADH-quinone oxidoreductase subunit NuoF [Acidobacteriota bacterium]
MTLPPRLENKFSELLKRYPVKRSALVPMLLYTQDVFGYIGDEMVAEIARRLDLNTLQVTETLVYYSMLRREPAGRCHVQVCTNIACKLRGGEKLWEHAQKRLGVGHKQTSADGVFSLEEVECIGACTGAPAVQVNYDFHENLTPEKLDKILDEFQAGRKPSPAPYIIGSIHERHPAEAPVISRRFGIPNSRKIDVYRKHEGYQALEKALNEMTPESIIEEVKKSNLRGRGGAGFPAGMKWSFVPKDSPKPKYIIANADESEPGTCKDRPLMEFDPHQLIEGMVIAGRSVNSYQGYIYVRGEYRYVLDIMDEAIREAYEHGFLGKNILGSGFNFDLCTHTGAGAYECGEESALMESLEGKRGYPRIRPPFPAVVGLYGCPTVINNVETLSSVPSVILKGAEWYANLGPARNGGTRLFCISGHVNKPGIYELPMGFNLLRMINEVAGGVRGGKKLKAVVPGGSSTPALKAEECDIPMDFDSLAKAGSMLGSGGVVVLDEDTCMVDFARRIMKFYAHESCGWCIPCREGTSWIKKILDRFHAGGGRAEDIPLIDEAAKNMFGRTFCPLGDAAAMPTMAIVKKWRHEFEEHLNGRCPYKPLDVPVGV